MNQYKTLQSLPKGIANNLPLHAQEIYQSTFNSALEDHMEEKNPESIAHKVAWAAVKQSYEQNGSGLWQKKAAHAK